RWHAAASSTRIAGGATMGWWTWAIASTIASTMGTMCLPEGVASISTASRASGARPRLDWPNGAGCPHLFYLHLKECKFRFNHRHENLYAVLLEMQRGSSKLVLTLS